MNKVSKTISSIQSYYKEKELEALTISWASQYSSTFNDEKLCSLFENVFNESADYFEIKGKAKEVVEQLVINYYHNEAFIKAHFIDYLKNKKSISFFELPVGNSRIDICSINGFSCAYEIKTKYDSLKRLDKQLEDYLCVFEHVYVICSTDKKEELLSVIPECVGLYTYDDLSENPSFEIVKEAKTSPFINLHIQFSVLRQNEREKAIGFLNNKELMNNFFKQCLKNRYRKKWDVFCKHPKSLNRLDYQFYFNSIQCS